MYKYLTDSDSAKKVNSLLATFDEEHQRLFFSLYAKIKESVKDDKLDLRHYFNTIIKFEKDFKNLPVDKHEFLLKIIKDVEVKYSVNLETHYMLKSHFDLARKARRRRGGQRRADAT